jgi:hypothetical protein
MSKRKQVREERRRDQVEVNLMHQNEDRGPLGTARRGCTLPFLGGSLLVVAMVVLHAAAA